MLNNGPAGLGSRPDRPAAGGPNLAIKLSALPASYSSRKEKHLILRRGPALVW